MILKASDEGIGEKLKVVLNKVSEFEKIKGGTARLLDMEMESSPPSKEGKRIKKLLALLVGNEPIDLDDLAILGKKEKKYIMISKNREWTRKYLGRS